MITFLSLHSSVAAVISDNARCISTKCFSGRFLRDAQFILLSFPRNLIAVAKVGTKAIFLDFGRHIMEAYLYLFN